MWWKQWKEEGGWDGSSSRTFLQQLQRKAKGNNPCSVAGWHCCCTASWQNKHHGHLVKVQKLSVLLAGSTTLQGDLWQTNNAVFIQVIDCIIYGKIALAYSSALRKTYLIKSSHPSYQRFPGMGFIGWCVVLSMFLNCLDSLDGIQVNADVCHSSFRSFTGDLPTFSLHHADCHHLVLR